MAGETAVQTGPATWQLDPAHIERRVLGEAHDDDHSARPLQRREGAGS